MVNQDAILGPTFFDYKRADIVFGYRYLVTNLAVALGDIPIDTWVTYWESAPATFRGSN
jgi:hypothetical protein